MSAACNHQVGYIPPAEVTCGDWNQKLAEFVAKVEENNTQDELDQLNHSGLIRENKACGKCGAPLDRVALGLLNYTEALAIYMADLYHPTQPVTASAFQDDNYGHD